MKIKHKLWGSALLLASAAHAQSEKLPVQNRPVCEEATCVSLRDLTPRFLDFYAAAKDQPDPEARFSLWNERYGFAAVPPGPRGEAMARQLLDAAWSRYPALTAKVEPEAEAVATESAETLARISQLLGLRDAPEVVVLAFVGGFEENAFTSTNADGVPQLAVAVETPRAKRSLLIAHEMTHAVHLRTANLSGGWERSIAEVMFQEGLAMHMTREVHPGKPLWNYTGDRDWWDKASASRKAIFADLLPVLGSKDGETVFRYTIGQSTAGLERTAYVGGWFVIDHLRKRGKSLAEIARIPELQIAEICREALEELSNDKPR